MQRLAGSSEVRLFGEVCGVDDERIALPTASRVPSPLANVLGQMRTPVQRDHTSVVDHLVENHHVSGSLEKLNDIVIGTWKHRGSGVASQDTTLPQVSVLRPGSRALPDG